MNMHNSIVIDIQSASIRGTLLSNNAKKEIIRTANKNLSKNYNLNTDARIKLMLKSLSDILIDFSSFHSIDNIKIILSSPWIIMNAKTIRADFDNNILIDENLINNLIKESTLEDDNDNNLEEIIYLDRNIIEIKLNGYSVNNYINKKANQIELSYINIFSSSKLIKLIDNTVKNVFGRLSIKYYSSPLLNFISIRNIYSNLKDYIYINIHGEITDILIVKDGIINSILSIPSGSNHLIKRISDKLNIDSIIANSLLSINNRDILHEKEILNINNIKNEYLQYWINLLKESINKNQNLDLLSKQFFIHSDSHLNHYKDFMKIEFADNINFIDNDFDINNMHHIALNDII